MRGVLKLLLFFLWNKYQITLAFPGAASLWQFDHFHHKVIYTYSRDSSATIMCTVTVASINNHYENKADIILISCELKGGNKRLANTRVYKSRNFLFVNGLFVLEFRTWPKIIFNNMVFYILWLDCRKMFLYIYGLKATFSVLSEKAVLD